MHYSRVMRIITLALKFINAAVMRTFVRGYEDAAGGNIPRNCVLWEIAKRIYRESTGGGALVFQAGYHPLKRTFKTHPKHGFFQV